MQQLRLRILIAAVVVFSSACGPPHPSSGNADDVYVIAARTVRRTLLLTGHVTPKQTTDVKAPVSGRLLRFLVDDGEQVRSGQAIAIIEPDQTQALLLSQFAMDVRLKELAVEKAQRDYNRSMALNRNGLTSKSDLEGAEINLAVAREQLRLAQRQLITLNRRSPQIAAGRSASYALIAPVSGTVLTPLVAPGETIVAGTTGSANGGTVVLKIADISSFTARTDVSEVDVGSLQPGMPADIHVAGIGTTVLHGHVVRIGVGGSATAGVVTYPVDIAVDSHALLRPEMSCEVDVTLAEHSGVNAVPANALLKTTSGTFLVDAETSRPIRVTTGFVGDGLVEITSGVLVGQRIRVPAEKPGADQ